METVNCRIRIWDIIRSYVYCYKDDHMNDILMHLFLFGCFCFYALCAWILKQVNDPGGLLMGIGLLSLLILPFIGESIEHLKPFWMRFVWAIVFILGYFFGLCWIFS